MHRLLWLLAPLWLSLLACKSADVVEQERREQSHRDNLSEGRRLLEIGQSNQAVRAFERAVSDAPKDPATYLLLATAQRASGHDGAALLALKQASQLTGEAELPLRKQMAQLYAELGSANAAIALWSRLREEGKLDDGELIALARFQAERGDVKNGLLTLQGLLGRVPESPDGKLAQAELMLLDGRELEAGRVMDRLVREFPTMVPLRLLRARYFLNSGHPELANSELSHLSPDGQKQGAVLELRARVLRYLGRYPDADKLLTAASLAHPEDAELVAHLAEVKLEANDLEAAESLVERVLTKSPRSPHALFVRGRLKELKKDYSSASRDYQEALYVKPRFAPARSRLWRLYEQTGHKAEALEELERLFFSNEASLEERARLAERYFQARAQLERAKALAKEAVRQAPSNERYRELEQALNNVDNAENAEGPTIIRGSRH